MRQTKIEQKQYNSWLVLSKPFKKKGIYYVSAKCVCGKILKVKKNNILNGRSKSCGCIQQSNLTNITKNKPAWNSVTAQHLAVTELFNQYKYSAKTREYSFSISRDEFEKLIFSNCHYCNKIPSNKKISKDEVVLYNGIDRYVNSIGYETENCYTCCETCNIMKNDMKYHEFISHISNILRNTKTSEPITEDTLDYLHTKALAVSTASHDSETKVGALLINPTTSAVMSEGYNGFVRGAPDDKLPNTRPEKYTYMIHAETNLICNAVRSGVKTDGAILYCTLSPCINCVRLLWQSGISEIYFKEKYRDLDESKSMMDLSIVVDPYYSYFRMKLEKTSS